MEEEKSRYRRYRQRQVVSRFLLRRHRATLLARLIFDGLQHTKTHINAGLFQAVAVAVSRRVCLRQSAHFSPRSVVGGHEAFYPGCPRCRVTGYRRVKGRRDGALQGDWDSRCRLTGWAGTVGEQRHFSNCAATKVALSSGMVNPRRIYH